MKGLLLTWGTCALLALAGTGTAAAAPVAQHELACLDDATLQAIRLAPDEGFAAATTACADELADDLGPAFADLGTASRRLILATVVAHELAPYGDDPRSYELRDLVHASTLACDAYVKLAVDLARSAGAIPRAESVGWDDGPVGNHAQLVTAVPGRQLLLDPTTGLVARTSLEAVLDGTPVDSTNMVLFPRDDGPPSVPQLRQMTVDALYTGTLGDSTLLYTRAA